MPRIKFALLISGFIAMLLTLPVCINRGIAGQQLESTATIEIPEKQLLAQSDIEGGEPVTVRLFDLNLKDQDGKTVNFQRDVIGDKVAVVIPFYTTCTISYPILIFVFTRLQDLLGERLNREVVLVSVTVDPMTDIPIRLKAFARRQKARPGWVFLTGDSKSLAKVLLGVRVLPTESLEGHNHEPVTMVGRAGVEWRRFRGFPTPEELLNQIEKYLAEQKQS